MNKLEWGHIFSNISLWNILDTQGQLTPSSWSEFRSGRNSFTGVLITCKYEKDMIRNNRENVETSIYEARKGSIHRSQRSNLAEI